MEDYIKFEDGVYRYIPPEEPIDVSIYDGLTDQEEYALKAYLKHGYKYEDALKRVENDEYFIYYDCRSYEEFAYFLLEDKYLGETEKLIKSDPNLLKNTVEEIKSDSHYAYEFFDDVCVQLYLDSVEWHK